MNDLIQEHLRLVGAYTAACMHSTGAESMEDAAACKRQRDEALDAVAASTLKLLAHHPEFKQIGWTCGDGDCGRIHDAPAADGSYATPVYMAQK